MDSLVTLDLSRLEERIQEFYALCSKSDQTINENINKRLKKLLNQLNNKEDNDYSAIREQDRLKDRLQEFNYKDSRAWKELERMNWHERSQKELVSIAQVIAKHCNIDLDRESKRRKEVLIKWFDDHLEEILPSFDQIELVF